MIQHPSLDDVEAQKLPDIVPVLPLKEAVVFPYIIVPLSVSSQKSVQAVDHALGEDRLLMLVAQLDPNVEDPQPADLHSIGSLGMIMRMLKLPDGRIRILVQGLVRARIENLSQTEPYLKGRITRVSGGVASPSVASSAAASSADLEQKALVRSVRDHLEKALHLGILGSFILKRN